MLMKKFKTITGVHLDTIIYDTSLYSTKQLIDAFVRIPKCMKYRPNNKFIAILFFTSIDNVKALPESFTTRLFFDGRKWTYDHSRDGDKELRKIKLFIKKEYYDNN